MPFTQEDREGVTFPYKDGLVIFIILSKVYRVVMDDGSVVNIISSKVMAQIGIPPLKTDFSEDSSHRDKRLGHANEEHLENSSYYRHSP